LRGAASLMAEDFAGIKSGRLPAEHGT
jgi:hypothetical protein